MTDPVIKFDPDNEAHVRIMRRVVARIRVPHGVGAAKGRRPGDGEPPEVLDEDVTAEDAARVVLPGRGW